MCVREKLAYRGGQMVKTMEVQWAMGPCAFVSAHMVPLPPFGTLCASLPECVLWQRCCNKSYRGSPEVVRRPPRSSQCSLDPLLPMAKSSSGGPADVLTDAARPFIHCCPPDLAWRHSWQLSGSSHSITAHKENRVRGTGWVGLGSSLSCSSVYEISMLRTPGMDSSPEYTAHLTHKPQWLWRMSWAQSLVVPFQPMMLRSETCPIFTEAGVLPLPWVMGA